MIRPRPLNVYCCSSTNNSSPFAQWKLENWNKIAANIYWIELGLARETLSKLIEANEWKIMFNARLSSADPSNSSDYAQFHLERISNYSNKLKFDVHGKYGNMWTFCLTAISHLSRHIVLHSITWWSCNSHKINISVGKYEMLLLLN